MPDQQQAQQQMQQYQQIQQQMEEVEDFIEQVQGNIEEMDETMKAINQLEDQETGSEILVPIGSGVFVTGELKENDKVVANIGGEAFEKKDLDSAENLIQKKRDEFEDTKEELHSTMQELQQQMQQIQQQIQQQREGASEE
ncbi:MAG: prefoldin subunit alpha [Nanohaloarchaea archaeon SW_4_43_9]|nr:MAG: prefoldin subunit alpha [Nanohaloarchaea archaeon SW_4_43_9]